MQVAAGRRGSLSEEGFAVTAHGRLLDEHCTNAHGKVWRAAMRFAGGSLPFVPSQPPHGPTGQLLRLKHAYGVQVYS